jgi:hypothetical protein
MEDIEEGRFFTFYDIIKDGNDEIKPVDIIQQIAAEAVGISIPSPIKKNYVADITNRVLGLNNWYRDKNMSDKEYKAAYKDEGIQKPILINALDRSVSVQGVTENKISEAIKNTFIDASFDPSRYIIDYTNLYIHPHHSDPAARPKPGDGKNTFYLATGLNNLIDAAIPIIYLTPFFGENSFVKTKFVSEGIIQITINIRGVYIIDGNLNVDGNFEGTINGITAPTDLFKGNQVKNSYIKRNGIDLTSVCYAICKEIGDLYQVLYIKAIIDYNNLLINVNKIPGHENEPITADNSLILTPDKPVSARSRIRAIPVLLRYCNASLGIISSIFFPAGDPQKMKKAIIEAFITQIINHNNKQIEFLEYFDKSKSGSITVIDRKIGTFTCAYSNISDSTKEFAQQCVQVINNCNKYLNELKDNLIMNIYKDPKIQLDSPIDNIRAQITNYKAHSLFKGGANELSIDAGMQSKITYYKLRDDPLKFNYNIRSPFSAVFMGKFRTSFGIRSTEEYRGGTIRGGSEEPIDIKKEAWYFSVVNTIFDIIGCAFVRDENRLKNIINKIDSDFPPILDLANETFEPQTTTRSQTFSLGNVEENMPDNDIEGNVEENMPDNDIEYTEILNKTLLNLEKPGFFKINKIPNKIAEMVKTFNSIYEMEKAKMEEKARIEQSIHVSPVSSQPDIQEFTPQGNIPLARPGNMSPSEKTGQYFLNIDSGPGTPRVTPRSKPPRTISLRRRKTFGEPEELITGEKRPINLVDVPEPIKGGKKSRKKNTKRSVNRVRKTKLRKTKKVNKTKLRKTKKNKK